MNFEQDIVNCLEVLKKGGTILYPTDTVWGIGCDATNELAVEKIFQIKIVKICKFTGLSAFSRLLPCNRSFFVIYKF